MVMKVYIKYKAKFYDLIEDDVKEIEGFLLSRKNKDSQDLSTKWFWDKEIAETFIKSSNRIDSYFHYFIEPDLLKGPLDPFPKGLHARQQRWEVKKSKYDEIFNFIYSSIADDSNLDWQLFIPKYSYEELESLDKSIIKDLYKLPKLRIRVYLNNGTKGVDMTQVEKKELDLSIEELFRLKELLNLPTYMSIPFNIRIMDTYNEELIPFIEKVLELDIDLKSYKYFIESRLEKEIEFNSMIPGS